MHHSFIFYLKTTLLATPSLSDVTRSFTQTVEEKDGYMTCVVVQDHGGRLHPMAYFSSKLDRVAAGFPKGLQAVADAEGAEMQ